MANANLEKMLEKFGVVTVMDVEVYKAQRYKYEDITDTLVADGYEEGDWNAKETFTTDNRITSLRTLKISNINSEGPTKTATGGQNADTLIKYGKTFTIEMQDALGYYDVLKAFYGAQEGNVVDTKIGILSVTDRFPAELTLKGKTFVVDQATGAKQPINIVIPIFLGDGIFNLTQDAEGDISTFDLNGSILRFTNGAEGTIDDNGKYTKGGDNQFYYFATTEAQAAVESDGYLETFKRTTAAVEE